MIVPDLSKKAFSLFTIKQDISSGFFIDALDWVEGIPLELFLPWMDAGFRDMLSVPNDKLLIYFV